jgi:hypothetical protein
LRALLQEGVLKRRDKRLNIHNLKFKEQYRSTAEQLRAINHLKMPILQRGVLGIRLGTYLRTSLSLSLRTKEADFPRASCPN